MQQFVVIAYDVVKDKTRKRISDTLIDFGGTRVQVQRFRVRAHDCETGNAA